jgi:hypothetical protein
LLLADAYHRAGSTRSKSIEKINFKAGKKATLMRGISEAMLYNLLPKYGAASDNGPEIRPGRTSSRRPFEYVTQQTLDLSGAA